MSKTPHICFVAPDIYPVLVNDPTIQVVGGAEVQQCFLARALVASGYRVTILTGDFGQAHDLTIDGMRVLSMRRSSFNLPVLRYVHPRLTSIWRGMAEVDADVYYQRCASAITGVVVAFAHWHKRRAVFASASDIDLLPGRANGNKGWRDRQLFTFGLRHAHAVVVQNPLQQARYLSWIGKNAVRIASCYVPPATSKIDPQARLVLWVGMMRVAKRPEIVLELAERMPHLRFRMIGGPSSSGDADDFYRNIEARAKALPNVEFLGFVPYSEAEAHFDQASLFLNTSEIEGFPNTFLQAWARSVPSLSFFDCGAADSEGKLGAVVANIDEMERVLERLMSDDQARQALGQRCNRYYLAHHHVSATLKSLEKLITSVLE